MGELQKNPSSGPYVKALYYTVGGLIFMAGTVFLVAWKSPPYYIVRGPVEVRYDAIVPFADYGSIIDHDRPMILRHEGLTVFGAEHTRDPDDPQIELIEAEWKALRPTVALVEGRLDFLLPGLMDPVRNLGEGGKVRELAGSDGVDIYNWDLSKEELAVQMMKTFEPDQVALAQILNPYVGNRRFGRPESPEAYVEEYLHRAEFVGREEAFRSVEDVERAWERYFPSGPDWRDVSDEHGLPGFLAEMMPVTNDLRNRQLLAAVTELRSKGERVFVIAGSSHAACLAPALTGE